MITPVYHLPKKSHQVRLIKGLKVYGCQILHLVKKSIDYAYFPSNYSPARKVTRNWHYIDPYQPRVAIPPVALGLWYDDPDDEQAADLPQQVTVDEIELLFNPQTPGGYDYKGIKPILTERDGIFIAEDTLYSGWTNGYIIVLNDKYPFTKKTIETRQLAVNSTVAQMSEDRPAMLIKHTRWSGFDDNPVYCISGSYFQKKYIDFFYRNTSAGKEISFTLREDRKAVGVWVDKALVGIVTGICLNGGDPGEATPNMLPKQPKVGIF